VASASVLDCVSFCSTALSVLAQCFHSPSFRFRFRNKHQTSRCTLWYNKTAVNTRDAVTAKPDWLVSGDCREREQATSTIVKFRASYIQLSRTTRHYTRTKVHPVPLHSLQGADLIWAFLGRCRSSRRTFCCRQSDTLYKPAGHPIYSYCRVTNCTFVLLSWLTYLVS